MRRRPTRSEEAVAFTTRRYVNGEIDLPTFEQLIYYALRYWDAPLSPSERWQAGVRGRLANYTR